MKEKSSSEALRRAIKKGDLAALRALPRSAPRAMLEFGLEGPLQLAAAHDHVAIVRELIARGVPLDAQDHDGATALHVCAERGHRATARALIAAGASLDVLSRPEEPQQARLLWGTSPLMLAASRGDLAMVKLLLEAGADPRVQRKGSDSALHFAARNKAATAAKVLRALVAAGAHLDAPGERGQTALHAACEASATAAVKTLLELGAKSDVRDAKKKLPMDLATSRAIWSAFEAAGVGARVDLHEAAAKGDAARVASALERGQAIDARKSAEKKTALHLAAEHGHAAVVRVLLDAGADLEAADRGGMTPLLWAIERRRRPVVSLLRERGANLLATTGRGYGALHSACSAQDLALLEELVSAGMSPEAPTPWLNGGTLLHVAASWGAQKVVRWLLERGVAVDASDNKGRTPLHLAAKSNRSEVITALLDGGAAVDAADRAGDTALHVAAGAGFSVVVRTLLARGANVNPLNRGKRTPLDLARGKAAALLKDAGGKLKPYLNPKAMRENVKMGTFGHESLRSLLARGNDPNLPMRAGGHTLLVEAVLRGDRVAAKILLDAGADPTLPFGRGGKQNALTAAAGDKAMLRLLTRAAPTDAG